MGGGAGPVLCQRGAQDPLAVRVAPAGAVEVGEIHRGGREARIELQCHPQGCLGVDRALLGHVQQSQVHVRLGTVGVEALGGHVLSQSSLQGGAVRLQQAVGHAGQGARGLLAHVAHGVDEQRSQKLDARGRVGRLQGTGRRAPHKRAGVAQASPDDLG